MQIESGVPLPVENPVSLSNVRRTHPAKLKAIAEGDKTYFTGKPCKNGHIAFRFVSTNGCVECQKIKMRVWHSSQHGKQVTHLNWIKNAYGLSENQYIVMLVKQWFRCECCKEPFILTPHTDHDSVTGEVKALLCGQCNKGIGHFNHSSERLRNAVTYCEKYR